MANNDSATKADLKVLRTELKGDMAALRDELKADIAALDGNMKSIRDELAELIHDMETKLLTAFYGFAEATQKRVSLLENTTGGLTNLIATLDRRITDLEKRVNFPDSP